MRYEPIFGVFREVSASGRAHGFLALTLGLVALIGCGEGQTTSSIPPLSLDASASRLDFGGVLDGYSSSLNCILTNDGNSEITISQVSVIGAGFSASGISNGTTLMPGQSATLTATFAPTSPGLINDASVSIASNAADSTLSIGLSGNGLNYVVLTWGPSPTGNVAYNVFRGTTPGGEGPTPINLFPLTTLSYIDTDVFAGGDYYYVVVAQNSGGNSAPSNEVLAQIPTQ
jgi:hypothetical protein